MTKPSSRQQLIDYSLRKLGFPVLEINVDDDQIDDLVDDALQYFQERPKIACGLVSRVNPLPGTPRKTREKRKERKEGDCTMRIIQGCDY